MDADKLARLKAYMRVTDSEDDGLISILYRAAASYLLNAGIREPEPETPRAAQYELAIWALALDAYDRRERTITGTIVSNNPAVRMLINQLKLGEPGIF